MVPKTLFDMYKFMSRKCLVYHFDRYEKTSARYKYYKSTGRTRNVSEIRRARTRLHVDRCAVGVNNPTTMHRPEKMPNVVAKWPVTDIPVNPFVGIPRTLLHCSR